MRAQLKTDVQEWELRSVGNINSEYWLSPCPVNTFRVGDLFDLVGNVWQHTITPIYPFNSFDIHPLY